MYKRFRFVGCSLALMLAVAFGACKEERKSYDAELKEFCFVKYVGKDTTVRLSTDTVRPQSTEVQVRVVSGTDVAKLIPWFTLSVGATADKVIGTEYDAREGFDITVTSENGKVQRTYHFDVSIEDAPDWGDGRSVDSVFLNGDAYIEKVRLKGFEDVLPRQRGKRIYFELPEGTDITHLAPIFELPAGATAEFESGTVYDFTEPLYIRVNSEDKKESVGYVIYVKVAGPPPSTEARIWNFRFDETLAKPVMQGTSIYIAVESGLELTHLTPRFERSDGARVDVVSGEPRDFSQPVKITVRSQDGSAKSVYTVTAEQVKRSEANLLDFRISEIRGGLPTFRDDKAIYYYIVDSEVALNKLTPIFKVSDGATLSTAGGVKLVSGNTYDFSEVGQLVVTSEDGASRRVYDLALKKGAGNNTAWRGHVKIHSFDFLAPQCVVPPVIMSDRIECIVPAGTKLTNLIPVFSLGKLVAKSTLHLTSTGAEIVSGTTEIDCSSPVDVYVKNLAEKGRYTLEVKVANEAMVVGGLKSFTLKYEGGEVKGSIGNGRVYVLLPPGVDVKRLQPEYEVTAGYRCDLRTGIPKDFSGLVRFNVSSADGRVVRSYDVEVRQGKNTEAELFGFMIDGLAAPRVKGNEITFYGIPENVDASNLVPRFSVSRGARASIVSGVARSFKEPVRIEVVSEDGSMRQVYTVEVEQRLNSEAELLSFRFKEFGDGLAIVGGVVTFEPPAGVDVRRLTPIFEVSSGATTSLRSGQVADFSKPLRFVVTSQDGATMKSYTVRKAVQDQGLRFDFEEWKSIGSGELAYEQPKGTWSSGNEGVKTSRQVLKRPKYYPLRKTTDAHSGNYAAELTTELVNNTMMVKVRIAAGSLFLGTFNANNIMADPLSGPQFGIPYSGALPERLQGWYKYQPGADNLDNDGNALGKPDECDIYAILYTGSVLTAKDVKDNPRIVAKARLKDRGAKGEWTKFDEEFVYYREPKPGEELKFSIVMTSSVNGDSYSGAVGSRLVVDDVEVVLR